MNGFYKQPKILQWIEAILLLLFGFLPALSIIEKGYSQPIFYLLFIIYVPIGQFAFSPIFKLIGVYKYYSPMLLGYMANDHQIDLHSGGSFDYLFIMRKYRAGIEIRTKILLYHMEGLIKIIQLIENKSIPETVNIVGTSYFFNDRTLSKMGFEIENPSLFYRLNLFINFIDLIWMYSLSQGKLAIPKLWNAKKANITGAKLVESKKVIVDLYEKTNDNIKARYFQKMKTSKGLYYWFALFALCFIAYQQVQDNIRPAYTGRNLTIIYLLGIAPNFFPAIGIPALFILIIPQMQWTNKWLNEKKHITANLFSLTGLISWEFLQTITTRGHFDWNDILWTLIGALVFQLIWTFTPL